MKIKSIALVSIMVVAPLVACGPSGSARPQPAAPAPGAVTAERVQPPPVHALLGYREELELTSEQVEAIDSIGQWLFSSGDEMRARLREVQASRPPRGDPQATTATLSMLTSLRDRNREATEGVQALLTDEQEAKVCELFREDRSRSASREPPARARRPAGYTPGPLPPVWSWCAPQADADEATADR
jgi:hypothetical protein